MPAPKPSLALMARRLGIMVGFNLLDYSEALDLLMREVVARANDRQMRRLTEIEWWLGSLLVDAASWALERVLMRGAAR